MLDSLPQPPNIEKCIYADVLWQQVVVVDAPRAAAACCAQSIPVAGSPQDDEVYDRKEHGTTYTPSPWQPIVYPEILPVSQLPRRVGVRETEIKRSNYDQKRPYTGVHHVRPTRTRKAVKFTEKETKTSDHQQRTSIVMD